MPLLTQNDKVVFYKQIKKIIRGTDFYEKSTSSQDLAQIKFGERTLKGKYQI